MNQLSVCRFEAAPFVSPGTPLSQISVNSEAYYAKGAGNTVSSSVALELDLHGWHLLFIIEDFPAKSWAVGDFLFVRFGGGLSETTSAVFGMDPASCLFASGLKLLMLATVSLFVVV